MKTKKTEINIKYVTLDNKTRKGDYVYLRQHGKPGRYYKNVQIEQIPKLILQYQGKYVTKEIPSRPKIRLKSIPIEPALKKGISQSVIKGMLNPTEQTIRKANKTILKKLVKDKGVLDILSQETNMVKLRNRLLITAEFIDHAGKKIGHIKTSRMTPAELANELNKTLRQEMTLTEMSNNLGLFTKHKMKHDESNDKLYAIHFKVKLIKGK